ncbi:hypothetical protein [Rummeliibacillus pycnus]|uniref:hypothetical protein n=1 Tax=Rummeliibacillus pycnus TaxID=101070 RepID=UPI003D2DE492
MELKTEDLSKELESLKESLINEKRSKIVIQEELLRMYNQEENLLNSYQKLQSQFHAISNSKLGKLTYVYWRFLKRIKRGKKNANY